MTDWTGSGTTIPAVVPAGGVSCLEYLTIAQLRDEYGEDIADVTDATLQRQIDEMVAYLEDRLGHTFGRGLIANSTVTESVAVDANGVTIGGDTYLFADYPTLHALVTAINAAGDTYSVDLLPKVRSDTPSTLLKPLTAVACGPAAHDRIVLCLSAMYCLLSPSGTHLFLPLNLATVTSIVESGTTLDTTDYWAHAGESWIIRKACSCLTNSCSHPRAYWLAGYPDNINVIFVPQYWGRVPGAVQGKLMDAFRSRAGLATFEAENFGDYSYRRGTAPVPTWQDILGGGDLRSYMTKFQP